MKGTWRIAAAGIVLVAAAGCGGGKTASRWASVPVQVNGALDEWKDAMVSCDDGALSVGFQNDANDLYVAIAASDPRLAMHVPGRGPLTPAASGPSASWAAAR